LFFGRHLLEFLNARAEIGCCFGHELNQSGGAAHRVLHLRTECVTGLKTHYRHQEVRISFEISGNFYDLFLKSVAAIFNTRNVDQVGHR